jgi:hypothetical protein
MCKSSLFKPPGSGILVPCRDDVDGHQAFTPDLIACHDLERYQLHKLLAWNICMMNVPEEHHMHSSVQCQQQRMCLDIQPCELEASSQTKFTKSTAEKPLPLILGKMPNGSDLLQVFKLPTWQPAATWQHTTYTDANKQRKQCHSCMPSSSRITMTSPYITSTCECPAFIQKKSFLYKQLQLATLPTAQKTLSLFGNLPSTMHITMRTSNYSLRGTQRIHSTPQ